MKNDPIMDGYLRPSKTLKWPGFHFSFSVVCQYDQGMVAWQRFRLK